MCIVFHIGNFAPKNCHTGHYATVDNIWLERSASLDPQHTLTYFLNLMLKCGSCRSSSIRWIAKVEFWLILSELSCHNDG